MELRAIAVLNDEVTAHRVEIALQENGVPAMVRSLGGLSGILPPTRWEVMVREQDMLRASHIIRQLGLDGPGLLEGR